MNPYPNGWLVVFLQSRFAPWVARILPGVLLLVAALPDSGLRVPTGIFLASLAVLWVLSEVLRTLVHGVELDGYASTSASLAAIISSLAATQRRDGSPRILKHPAEAIDILLRRAKDLVVASLKIPPGEVITVHLLLPERGAHRRATGLRAIYHDDFRPSRSHEPIPLDAPGAAQAFLTDSPIAVAYTENETHPRIRGRQYRSILAIPVRVGETAHGGVNVAVLTLDSTKPYRFSASTLHRLDPFIEPIAQLIGLALELKNREGMES